MTYEDMRKKGALSAQQIRQFENKIMANEFLQKLATLCDEYDAALTYTTDDDGIHIYLGGQEVFAGFLESKAGDELRTAICT